MFNLVLTRRFASPLRRPRAYPATHGACPWLRATATPRLALGGLDVGINRRQRINPRIAGRNGFRCGGRIGVVRLMPGPQAPGSRIVMDEAAVQARMRAAAEPAHQ